MVVHSVLPDSLATAVNEELRAAGVACPTPADPAPRAAEAAAADGEAAALIGPFRSADVAEAIEATARAGLPSSRPWRPGRVTRDDEPGCDDAARHGGTVLRMVARDTEVAARIAADLRAGRRAFVVAGGHASGVQLDGQLRLAGLPRAEDPSDADLVVLCGLAGTPEIDRAAALAPLPVVAFDGAQGAGLGTGRDVTIALPVAPADGVVVGDVPVLRRAARRAARLVAGALAAGARDRAAVLSAMRAAGPFDEHGDPVDPPVWLWRAADDWSLTPDRPLNGG